MAKTRITITLDEKYVKDLDRIARIKKINRSALVEEAILLWEKENINRALVYGYQSMVKEDSQVVEEYIKIAGEILDD
ncbi:hypothetical protein A2Y85_07860 [candidate division WOR-3 bacterium RBG_13_43_14]|uniref:Ribbon-helix-helix protein CopG domain-containing protein n=1 Tax=candidate division WOR-3 bacterium RBG_13_43_14 TaxID=1802590 RepID=A0A1F4UG31_UNCW3|nr:MAG: hypothetical protein A2Y85_07860 [candidate division WOR-3 bacterium RBG_13_43_14]